MSVQMKALATFRGDGEEGRPKKGREFSTVDERRADELVAAGLAERINPKGKSEAAPQNKMEQQPVQNKGIITQQPQSRVEPMNLTGGRTGAATPAASSQAGRARRGQTSGGGETE